MKKIFNLLKENQKTISFMESCTGGFLANTLTNIEGASDVLKISLVTYSNEYKIKFGVSEETIKKYSVYSIETAKEMAKSVCILANSDYGIGVTGMLGKIDLNNKCEETNKVFFAIYDKKENTYIAEHILVSGISRNKMKKEIEKKIEQEFCRKYRQ